MSRKSLFILIFALSMSSAPLWAQNLVPNGDFDAKRGRRYSAKPWRFVNTVDYFAIAGGNRRPIDTDKWNLPKPKNGVGYVGLRIYSDYREFIQVKLTEKLKPATKYYFEMWISWSDHSTHYAKKFGASLYHKKPSYTSEYYIFGNPPQIELVDMNGIRQDDSTTWVKISGEYRAKGGELYLSIGNFSQTNFSDRLKKKHWYSPNFWHHEAYYFVDAVSLVELVENVPIDTLLAVAPSDSVPIKESDNYIYTIEKDSSVIIENLYFESGSDRILPGSFKDLELVLEYLNENSGKKIIIIGHTDNVGSTASNQKLSEKRAKSVYKYFIDNRISKTRIKFIGKGELDPIETNETSSGRKANRRVELKLVTSFDI